jgi:hypothetical protein
VGGGGDLLSSVKDLVFLHQNKIRAASFRKTEKYL